MQSQQISTSKFTTPEDIVSWMGAMQAQDLPMVKWAIGSRLPGSTEDLVNEALNNGDILRTHLLRPTWHIVTRDDIYRIITLTAPQIRNGLKSRHKVLEITKEVINKSFSVIENALNKSKYLSREELVQNLNHAKIATDKNRASHIFMLAELEAIICSGVVIGSKQTYTLFENRAFQKKSFTREESLAFLAKKYFKSHCPATLQDFTWWSGLTIGDARRSLEMVKNDLVEEIIEGQSYWIDPSLTLPGNFLESVHLLPSYDEFLISYTDRSAILPHSFHNKTVSDNGIFRPIIVHNGQVIGVWKRTIKKDVVFIETEFFTKPNKIVRDLIEISVKQFTNFLNKKIEIKL